jgi:hypothetical protein
MIIVRRYRRNEKNSNPKEGMMDKCSIQNKRKPQSNGRSKERIVIIIAKKGATNNRKKKAAVRVRILN